MSHQQRDSIAYIGLLAFPEGEAGSRRMLGIARTLAECGENVTVVAGRGEYSPVSLMQSPGALGTIRHVGIGEYDRNWPVPKKMWHVFFAGGQRTVQWLDNQPTKPKAVILYGTSAPFLTRLLGWCKHHKVPLICDVVEWYSAGQLGGGLVNPIHLEMQFALRRLVPQCDGVIGISSLLCNYYECRGCATLRMPPTLDTASVACRIDEPRAGGPIQIVYAGVPHKKDLLGNVIEGLKQYDPTGRQFRLTVLGPDARTLDRVFPGYPRAVVEAVGRIPHGEVLNRVRSADYTVLLRPNLRYANAGFPTKVVESMTCGTPVVCNLTSDLGQHLREGKNAVVCSDETPEAFVDALRRIAAMDHAEVRQMREEARKQAERDFDYREYADCMKMFLARVISPASDGI